MIETRLQVKPLKVFLLCIGGVVNNLLIKRTVAKHLNTYYCTPRILVTFKGTLFQVINNRVVHLIIFVDEALSLFEGTLRELT